ncbi:MAG: GntR family transcriptional regulator [Planctomycetota bacterium]|jgi:GntR family transcriptional regulator
MITVSLNSSIPLQDQLVAELRRLLATGKLSIGDELPPVRQLANDLGINLNTVARAYRELTDAGLLTSVRGRGTVVVGTTERPRGKPGEERKRIEHVLGAALADAKIAGFSESEARAMIERQIERIWTS